MQFRQIIRYFAPNMKRPFYTSLLLCCAVWFIACTGPIILVEPEDGISAPDKNDSTYTDTEKDSTTIIHEGAYASPYSIAEAQALKSAKDAWIEGYIVGCVSGSMKNGCNYSQEATTQSNILLADTFPTGDENDYLLCLPVELPNGSIERDELNLYDNPDNYHRKVRILGDITLYYKVTGMKSVAGYIFSDDIELPNEDEDKNDDKDDNDNEEEEPETPSEPQDPYDPDATRQDTLSIAEAIKQQDKGEQPYIRGYIIGYYNGSSMIFNPTPEQISSRANNNVILADSIGETNQRNVIIVDLPTQTALRNDVNLKDHPDNLYRRLTVKGMLGEYKDTEYYGCNNTLSKMGDDEGYYFLLE